MKKQEFLEKIIGYMPHGLKSKEGLSIIGFDDNNWYFNCNINGEISTVGRSRDMLIVQLNPLSKLTEEITVDGETFVPMDEFFIAYGGGASKEAGGCFREDFLQNILYSPKSALSYGIIQRLHKWHFDIHNLIGQGLAIEKE